MQYNNKDYNPDQHDRWRALTVKNPFATQLVTAAYDDNGIIYGEKTIEVRSKSTKYRGDLLICSSKKPDLPGYENGVTLGLVELYDVKPVSEFTPSDWEQTRIPPEKRNKIIKGYGWLMRNPRRVIEFPIKGQLGIYNLVYTKGCIRAYPTALVMDKMGYELARKEAQNDQG